MAQPDAGAEGAESEFRVAEGVDGVGGAAGVFDACVHMASKEVLKPVVCRRGASRPTPPSREIVFHSGNGNCTIVSQPCFTTRNLRTKLCGIRAKQKSRSSWTHSNPGTWKRLLISEMENRRASPDPRLGEGLN